MQNVTIGRYSHESVTKDYAGWIEGQDESGSGWILYLDGSGRPVRYFSLREDDGAVIGEGVTLD